MYTGRNVGANTMCAKSRSDLHRLLLLGLEAGLQFVHIIPNHLKIFPAVRLKNTLIVRAVFSSACHLEFPSLMGHHCKTSCLVISVQYYYATWLIILHQPNKTEAQMAY